MTQTEMEEKLEEEVKGLSTYLEGDDYTNACNDASMETGWSFPVSTDFKILWMKQRAKRALFFYLPFSFILCQRVLINLNMSKLTFNIGLPSSNFLLR